MNVNYLSSCLLFLHPTNLTFHPSWKARGKEAQFHCKTRTVPPKETGTEMEKDAEKKIDGIVQNLLLIKDQQM